MNRERHVWDRKLRSKILGLERLRSCSVFHEFCKCNGHISPLQITRRKNQCRVLWTASLVGSSRARSCVTSAERWVRRAGDSLPSSLQLCFQTEAAPQPPSGPPGAFRCWHGALLMLEEVIHVFCFPDPQFSELYFSKLRPPPPIWLYDVYSESFPSFYVFFFGWLRSPWFMSLSLTCLYQF